LSPETEKAALVAAFFLSYSLLSEYQIQLEITPNIFGLVGVEVVWNEASLLWILGSPLDRFSR
jgi:hypothetical protein